MTNTRSTQAPASKADLVRQAIDALNRHDVAAARGAWAESAVWRVAGETYRGPHEIAGYFEQMFAAMPDWHLEVLATGEQDTDVFVHWRLTGHHAGAFDGIEPTGKPISLEGIDHFVLDGDRIASNTIVFDQLEFARQIGMMPAAGSTAERLTKAMFNVRTKALARLR